MTRPFLELLPRGLPLVVDLGCGPGRTTRLLAEVTGARRVVGLDASEDFVRRALGRGLAAKVHDCTTVPFPVPGAISLAYCRLLLPHLPDPVAVLDRWLGETELVALDELHSMEVDHPVLQRYEEVVTALVASRGGRMEVGPLLDAAPGERVRDDLRSLDVPAAVAARLYRMNLGAWREDPAVAAYDVDRLAADLETVDEGVVRWTHRQVVLSGRARTAASPRRRR